MSSMKKKKNLKLFNFNTLSLHSGQNLDSDFVLELFLYIRLPLMFLKMQVMLVQFLI